jgi:nucleoside-diphosphate-sugar epimerase
VNCLLVGSNGFIGSQITKQLEGKRHRVVRVDSSYANGKGFFDHEAIEKLFLENSFDYVISTAWNTDLATYRRSSGNFEYSASTINLAALTKRFEVPKFLALGSAAEYGSMNFNCLAGDSELVSHDPYSASKIDTFKVIEALLKSSLTQFIWCRIFQPFGINQDSNRFLPYLISSLISDKEPVINHPNYSFDWIDTEDIAGAILYILEREIDGAVDVGTSDGITNLDLFHLLVRISGKKLGWTSPSLDETAKGLVMSRDAILLKSGWRPKIERRVGLSRLFDGRLCEDLK